MSVDRDLAKALWTNPSSAYSRDCGCRGLVCVHVARMVPPLAAAILAEVSR